MHKKKRHLTTFLLTLLLLSLSGCVGTTPVPETPTEEPTEEEEVISEPVSAVEEVKETDYCLDCHTDKDSLITTAKEEEVVESESEGAG